MDVGKSLGASMGTDLTRGASSSHGITFKNTYHFECFAPDGTLKWEETVENLVVNEGLDYVLDVAWAGGTQSGTWYVGLMDGTPSVAAGDTLASHAGWTEVTDYSESVRQTLTLGTVSSQSVDNSASKAAFSIDTNSTTIGGAFIADDSTKGGTTGTLGGAAAFTGGNKSADSGDTLNVTVTLTASSS